MLACPGASALFFFRLSSSARLAMTSSHLTRSMLALRHCDGLPLESSRLVLTALHLQVKGFRGAAQGPNLRSWSKVIFSIFELLPSHDKESQASEEIRNEQGYKWLDCFLGVNKSCRRSLIRELHYRAKFSFDHQHLCNPRLLQLTNFLTQWAGFRASSSSIRHFTFRRMRKSLSDFVGEHMLS